jgi:hypothetical protein
MKEALKQCQVNPRHRWLADISYCPYCNFSSEQRTLLAEEAKKQERKRRREQESMVVNNKQQRSG